MMGAAGLKGPSVAAAFARQRLTAVPRSTRSMSTFRPQRLRIPRHGGRFSLAFTGGAPWRATSVAAGPAAVRFNSSSSRTTDAPMPETTDSGALTEAGDLADFDITTMPEKIGYLKEIGLDYGWGPTSIMQYIIEHIHIWSDMPWWASIVGAGLLVRLLLLKPMLDASDVSAKLHNVKPVTNPIRQEMTRAMSENNQVEIHRKRAELTQAHHDAGVKVWKTMVPMLQIPFGYGIFRIVRGMTSLPVPAIMNESFLWLNDMTIADPMFILPGLTSLFMYLTFKRGGEAGLMDFMNTPAGKGVLIGLPVLSFCFMAFQPAALQLYFTSTGAWALGQSYLTHNNSFRRWMGMAIPQRVVSDTFHDPNNPSKGLELLEKRLAAEQRYYAELQKAKSQPQESPQKISVIDRWMDKGKKTFEEMTADAGKKVKELQGKPTKNPDGSDVAPTRLTDAERRKAEQYEAERQSLDAYAREERNEARRRAHMHALAAERRKARTSWQRQQEAAVKQQQQKRRK